MSVQPVLIDGGWQPARSPVASFGTVTLLVFARDGAQLLYDKMVTGVVVAPAMNHGGPNLAPAHPSFSAVGVPALLLSFAALPCYDNVRPHRLPPALADKNPNGQMWRYIDGTWTQADVPSS